MILSNEEISIKVSEENGLITELLSPLGAFNIADIDGMGSVCYTLKNDSIETETDFCPYIDKTASYTSVTCCDDKVICANNGVGIKTVYELSKDSLILTSEIKNDDTSEFGINFNFNFLGKKAKGYSGQLIPSSPYTSSDGGKTYCIMPVINNGFCIVAARTKCDGWKIDYSSYCAGHFIRNFKILASFDKAYNRTGERSVTVEVAFEKTVEACYKRLSLIYGCPMAYAEVTGSFENKIPVKIIGKADYVEVIYPEKSVKKIDLEPGQSVIEIKTDEYGLCTVIPYGAKKGLDTTLWFGTNLEQTFKNSCSAIKKPYHNDFNLCEGMVWLWSLLCYMTFYKNNEYMGRVSDVLKTIMSDTENTVDSLSILPYAFGGFPPYHVKNSDRIQEQFFGISILTEAFKLTKEQKYLDYACRSAETLVNTYQQESGAFVCSHGDYTTVCSPIIALVDLYKILRDKDTKISDFFANSAKRVVEYLITRGMNFPTETQETDLSDTEMEEGSISCTALSILYYCANIESKQEYIDFAEKVLKLHDWWRTYTPDARLYMSTMRWWETIWEGDGTGPAICGGHAWSIWRAEADYYMGILTRNADYMIKSWNGFITNFSKTQKDGTMYACYQPDYITGAGIVNIRKGLLQLKDEDISKKYEITHDYPKHTDNSLSRYAWVRAESTWFKTAALIKKGDAVIPINCRISGNKVEISDSISTLFVSGITEKYSVSNKNKLKLVGDDTNIVLLN